MAAKRFRKGRHVRIIKGNGRTVHHCTPLQLGDAYQRLTRLMVRYPDLNPLHLKVDTGEGKPTSLLTAVAGHIPDEAQA